MASKGALQTLVGSDEELFHKLESAFKSWGTPRYCGPVGILPPSSGLKQPTQKAQERQ